VTALAFSSWVMTRGLADADDRTVARFAPSHSILEPNCSSIFVTRTMLRRFRCQSQEANQTRRSDRCYVKSWPSLSAFNLVMGFQCGPSRGSAITLIPNAS
jgi:hypothetical protein